jgi:hypothetical protein
MLFKYPNYIYRSSYKDVYLSKASRKLNKNRIYSSLMLLTSSLVIHELVLVYRDWFIGWNYWENLVKLN